MDSLIKVRCKKDDDFEFYRRIQYSCGCDFAIKKGDIYSINYPGYEGDLQKQYYAVCPNCGYINMLDEHILPDEIKVIADIESKLEPYQYQKNNLKSETIYLEKVSHKKLTRTR